MTEPPQSTGGVPAAPLPVPDSAIDKRTRAAMERHVDHRLRELESDLAHLKKSRDGWKTRAESLAEELAWTRDHVARLGRPLRVWLTVRRAAHRPRSIIRLPVDLVRVLTAPPESITIAARPVPPDMIRAEARAQVQAAAVDRWLRRPAAMPLATLRVAIVADQPLLDALEPECRLVRLRPDRWRDQVTDERPDLVIVGAAWNGNDGAWRHRVATHAHRLSIGLPDLTALTAWAEAEHVPSVFWNTEDPVRTDRFADASMLFDWIVTVDPGCADEYRSLTMRRAAGVLVLGPAVQPRSALARTVAPGRLAAEALLATAGEPSWPLERREALLRLAAAADGIGLAVLDRRLGTVPRADLPDAVRDARRTGTPDDAPPGVYARHPVVLVPAPSTEVLPAAALEALACGVPVVMTGHSRAAALADAAVSTDDPFALRDAVRRLAADPSAGEVARRDGLRRAVAVGTWRERLGAVAAMAGIPVDTAGPQVSLALTVGDDGLPDRVVEALAQQERRPHQVVLGAIDWSAALPAQARLERAMPNVPVTLIELRPDLTPAEAACRVAAASDAPWLLNPNPDRLADTGLLDREAAHLETGVPGPDTLLLSREAVLGGTVAMLVNHGAEP